MSNTTPKQDSVAQEKQAEKKKSVTQYYALNKC